MEKGTTCESARPLEQFCHGVNQIMKQFYSTTLSNLDSVSFVSTDK